MLDPDAFPKDFLWGASTAAHQVEGGTENQWSVWELAHATELARTAERRLSWLPNWHEIKKEAEDPENYVSGKGVDHYNRYEEDFDLLQDINLNSLRFGVEWSRIEPQEGTWNIEAIRHYHSYINSLRKRGIEPILSLWHWTMPTWFTEKGGFEKKQNLQCFDRFVQKIAEEYGNDLTYILTLNEPNVYVNFSHLTGEWPPQEKNVLVAGKIYWNLTRAHRRAYEILKAVNPTLQIGVAAQLGNVQAKRPHNIIDGATTKVMRYAWNWWFLNRIKHCQDFVGLNYYFTDYYRGVKRKNPEFPVNDLGWYMEPEGMYPLLLRAWAHYRKPILITESGLANEDDSYRRWWIEESVIAMRRAMSEGVDVRGYMHWSLLDNFEWKYGWWPKFGLVEVDREHNMKRTLRPSAKWFAKYLARLQNSDKS
jgi:beta-glucosidase